MIVRAQVVGGEVQMEGRGAPRPERADDRRRSISITTVAPKTTSDSKIAAAQRDVEGNDVIDGGSSSGGGRADTTTWLRICNP